MIETLGALEAFLAAHALLAILFAFLVAFGEALLIVGLFVPSTVVLVGLGTLIGLGEMAFLPIFVATVIGAIAGDALSFWLGVHYKEQIRSMWPFSRYLVLMEAGERFIGRHGGKSIFIVRFIPGLKAVVPTLAGMMGMSPRYFAFVNVVSAVFWAAVHLIPAILLGRGLQLALVNTPHLLILAGIAVLAVFIGWVSMRFAHAVLIPAADRGRLRLVARLERGGPGKQALAEVLRAHVGALESGVVMGLTLTAIVGLALTLVWVTFGPEGPLSDASLGAFVQGLRDDLATSRMVSLQTAVTVMLVLGLGGAGVLLALRRWSQARALAYAAVASVVIGVALSALLR